MAEGNEIYILPRNENESKRLEEQHYMVKEIMGSLVHESIPRAGLLAIADLGTGTGVWLRETKEYLEALGGDPVQAREYHGFDISDAQFPKDASAGIQLHTHDIMLPFQPEYLGRFDLVYARHLVGAIMESNYEQLIRNMMTLLKPGGYLQWVDYDIDGQLRGNSPDYPTYAQLSKPAYDYITQKGLSTAAPAAIYEASRKAGLYDVAKYDYLPHKNIALRPRLSTWAMEALDSLLSVAYVRLGLVANQIDSIRKVAHTRERMEELFTQGLVPEYVWGSIVGRKS